MMGQLPAQQNVWMSAHDGTTTGSAERIIL